MQKILFPLTLLAFVIGVVACGGPAALPRASEGTLLRKIQDRGRLIVGVKYDQPTFGYLNPQTNQLEGFDVAIAREIAAYIFGDPNKIEFKPVASKDRIPYLKDGTVDVVLATFTITAERLKEVDFSIVYYVAGQRLLVLPDNNIRSIADLDGKKVGTGRGSTSADNLARLTTAQIVLFDTYSEALKAMLNGEVDAVSTDDSILYGLALLTPGVYVVGAQFSYEPLGAGVPKGQPELLNAINTAIKNLKTSGKWQKLWKTEIGNKLGLVTAADPPPDDWRR